jgi:Ca2+-binding RTX toxin-like protein
MADLDGAGGAKTFSFDFFTDTSIANFGAFGTGGAPDDPSELDTLAFTADGLTAANMILLQQGTSVLIRFDGSSSGTITLEDMAIERLGNTSGLGNFRFFGEATVTDSLDIWGAGETGAKVFGPGTVTFLNALDNDVGGFNEGNDVINGLAGNDTLNGFAGNDLLRGGEGDDALIGGLGNDRLQGDEGSDTLTGGRGDDVLDGGSGDDVLIGSKGNDVYVVDSLGDTIVEDIQNSRGGGWADEVRSSVSFSLAAYARIENLTLTGGDSEGIGNSNANVITAIGSFNTLKGGGGDDVLVGGGADEYHGGTGNDVIVLAEGDDAASGENGDPSLVDGGSGLDTVATEGFGRELDLTGDLREHFTAVEMFDLGTAGPATLILDAANVTQLAASNNNTVLVRGGADDLLAFGDSGWVEGGTR